jgi:hypothetical protein
MRTMTARWTILVGAAVLAAACGGGPGEGASFDDPGGGTTADAADAADAAEEAVEASTMPDVVGMPADEGIAQLEELGFQVSTGVVRTTEMEPDLVFRTEPAPGRSIREGQRVTVRISAEPRQ